MQHLVKFMCHFRSRSRSRSRSRGRGRGGSGSGSRSGSGSVLVLVVVLLLVPTGALVCSRDTMHPLLRNHSATALTIRLGFEILGTGSGFKS